MDRSRTSKHIPPFRIKEFIGGQKIPFQNHIAWAIASQKNQWCCACGTDDKNDVKSIIIP